MKLSSKIDILLFSLLLSSHFLSQRTNLLLVLAVFFFFIVHRKFKINIKMPGIKIYVYFLLSGLLIGLINHEEELFILFKQIYYVVMVFLYWFIGKQEALTNRINKKKLYTTIVYFSLCYCLFDFLLILQKINLVGSLDINSFRMEIGAGSLIPVIAVYLMITMSDEILITNKVKNILIGLFLIDILIHFSRTSLAVLVILFLFSGIKIWNSKWLQFGVYILVGAAITYYVFPSIFSSFMNKIFYTIRELDFKTTDWNATTITQNWRGYEVNCAIQQFVSNSLIAKIFGTGFGTTLDVHGYAYLVTNEDNLSFLHNGYFTILLVWGVSGVILFICWLFSFFKESKVLAVKEQKFVKGLVAAIAVVTYFIMGPFFSSYLSFFYCFLGVIFGLSKKQCNLLEEEHER